MISPPQEFFVQWHLTERCNLSCSHCYQNGVTMAELSRSEVGEVLGEIDEMLQAWQKAYALEFSPSLNVTGGEPFLRRDLFEILAEMRNRGFATYLLTNGTLVDQKKAAALADLGVKGVQVSLEGPQEIHDSIRGKGSFEAARRGVRHLLSAGLRVTLNATLSKINAERFDEMIDIAGAWKVQRLGFSRLVPSGRGLGMVDQMIEPVRLKGIYQAIFAHPVEGLEIVTGDPVASQLRDNREWNDCGMIATGGCAAGVSGLTILPDGGVTPCRRLAVVIGNVRHDSLREIWAGSPVLEQLRERPAYKNKCGACPRWAVCRGCRAIAYAGSLSRGDEDFLAEDPQCFLADQVADQ
ncbi:MAG: radical SAM protein [Desulfurivibrionaceae bacterium]